MLGDQIPPDPAALNSEDRDLVLPSTTKHAQQRSPFKISPPPMTIPGVGVFSGFNTALSDVGVYGPFSVSSPFESGAKYTLRVTALGEGNFADATVTASSSSYEHLSASLSVGVDVGILGGDVSVSYDKSVLDNHDSFKHSQHALYQDSIIDYGEIPNMTEEAKTLLSTSNGSQEFQKKYGDYFIAGFIIGAEAGMLLSRDHIFRDEVEVTEVTVTIKVLFWSKSFSVTDRQESSLDLRSYNFESFCTLDKTRDTILAGPTDVTQLIVDKVHDIQDMVDAGFRVIVEQRKQKLFGDEVLPTVWEGKQMQFLSVTSESTRLSQLMKSGIVWKILLEPYWNLPEYQASLKPA